MELFVEISSAAPQAGGAESEFPAWIIVVLETARTTRMDQGSWDWAPWAGVQVLVFWVMGWEADSQSVGW